MAMISRKSVDVAIEKQILLAMLTSKDFLLGIYNSFEDRYFQNKHHQIISKWIMDFFEMQETAPKEDIQNVFLLKSTTLKPEDAEILSEILQSISDIQEASGDPSNIPYLIKEVALPYFKKQELSQKVRETTHLLSQDRIDEAEDLLLNIKKISQITTKWVNPFDDDYVWEAFQEQTIEFFRMPGALGKFIGPFDRGWLVGISAPFKRGKTFFGLELAVQALLSNLRVAVITLEMSERDMAMRMYKRMAPSVAEDIPFNEAFVEPVWDCKKNQTGECLKPERYCRVRLLDEEGNKPAFDPNMTYEPCTYCKDHPDYFREYERDVWVRYAEWKYFEYPTVADPLIAANKRFKNHMRLLSFPKFTANVQDIMKALEILEQTENFIPDMLFIDYVDILKEEKEGMVGVAKEDRSWTALGSLAQMRHMLVVTPTQVTREGIEANTVKAKHSARWIGKLGHVDVLLALNQTPEEKKVGHMRVGMLAHRHRYFDENKQVSILQQMHAGQSHLDSL